MKKFYALMAAAIVGASFASAAIPTGMAKKVVGEPLTADQIMALDGQSLKTKHNLVSRNASRAEIDLSTYEQMVAYNYLTNWYDGATELSTFAGLQSGAKKSVEVLEDGTFVINDLFGLSDYNGMEDVPVYLTPGVDEDGYACLTMALGQKCGSEEDGTEYVLAVLGENGMETTGTVTWTIYTNAIACDYDGWICPAYMNAGKYTTYTNFPYADIILFAPNATLSYNIDGLSNGVTSCENRIYVEFKDPKTGADNDGTIFVSNVIYFNDGVSIVFEIVDGYIFAEEAVAYPNIRRQDGYSGRYIMCSGFNVAGQNYYDTMVFAEYDIENNVITWAHDNSEYGLTNVNSWFCMSETKSYFGDNSMATLKLDSDEEGGVNTIINDNTNAPVEYYNLQGMKVANPAAGQVIIKKQGTETSKFIVR